MLKFSLCSSYCPWYDCSYVENDAKWIH